MSVTVSVIIPTHNRVQFITRAIASVLNQTFQDFEIIIINDASSDETANVLQQYQHKDQRIHVITLHVAQGAGAARNAGIAISQGQWIGFLDDDDAWHPNKLEQQIKILLRSPQAVACSTGYVIHYPWQIKKKVSPSLTITLSQLLGSNSLGGCSVCLAATHALKKINGFDTRLRSSQDWDLWVRLRQIGEIVTLPQQLVDYYVHFNFRISNHMQAKLIGSRLFYFKHQHLMDRAARKKNVSFMCYIRSRQKERSRRKRMQYLAIAMRHSSKKQALAYLAASLPRMI